MATILSRRNLLKLMALSGVAWAYSPSVTLSDAKRKMMTRTIPRSGESIPVIGLGTWIQFDVSRFSADIELLKKVVANMNEIGGRMIDSSPMYGRSEETIGELTSQEELSNEFFYATKVWTRGRQAGIEQMETSMKKMRRRTMDLMQVHNLVDWQTHLQTLRTWKAEGKIRYFGFTHYTDSYHDQLSDIIAKEKPDFVQFNYSIRNRNAEKRLLQTAQDTGTAVIINQPFESGSLFNAVKGKALPEWAMDYEIKNWPQFFLKYIVSHPAVTCAIPGTSDPVHIVENMHAALGTLPDAKARKMMTAYFDNL